MTEKIKEGNGTPPEEQSSYEIGYGKPPVSGRFKPGQSGNPKGRKKGTRSAATIFRNLIEETITINEGGKAKRISRLEVVFRQTLAKALKGDLKAAAQLLATGRELAIIAPERIDPDADAQKRLTAEDREILLRHFPDAQFDMGE